MSSYGYCCFDLLQQISGIYIREGLLRRMIVRNTVFISALIILDLDCGRDTLLTEGNFIPSVTTGNDTRRQAKLIRINYPA